MVDALAKNFHQHTKSTINDGFDGEGMISFRNIIGYILADLADTKPESVIIQAGGNDLSSPSG